MQLNESSSQENNNGISLLEKVQEDILIEFNSAPFYGSVGFTIHLVEGEPIRIETYKNVSRKLKPKAKREVNHANC